MRLKEKRAHAVAYYLSNITDPQIEGPSFHKQDDGFVRFRFSYQATPGIEEYEFDAYIDIARVNDVDLGAARYVARKAERALL